MNTWFIYLFYLLVCKLSICRPECCWDDFAYGRLNRESLNSMPNGTFCNYIKNWKNNNIATLPLSSNSFPLGVCIDGVVSTFPRCALGRCNIFGCNCDGGCRRPILSDNSSECKSITLFREQYTVISIVETRRMYCDHLKFLVSKECGRRVKRDYFGRFGPDEVCTTYVSIHKTQCIPESCESDLKSLELVRKSCGAIVAGSGLLNLFTGGVTMPLTSIASITCVSANSVFTDNVESSCKQLVELAHRDNLNRETNNNITL